MPCKKCGSEENGYYDWGDDWCIACTEISIERSAKIKDWHDWHDGPCPEIELPQYPKHVKGQS